MASTLIKKMRSSSHRDRQTTKRLLAVLLMCGGMLVTQICVAEEPLLGSLKTMDTRAMGMAGALRASPASTSGVYLNPATIAMAHLYHIGAMYQYTGEEDLHMGGLAIVDSVTSAVIAAGLSLNYLRSDQRRTDHESWDARLSLAGSIADIFFIGMTGRYLRVESDLERPDRGPNGPPALPRSGSQQVDGFTFDAGAAVRLGDVVSLGVTGYNLTDTGSAYAPLQLGTGAALFLLDMLTIEADLVIDFTQHDEVNEEIHVGGEVFIAGRVPIRLGYIYDVYYERNRATAGLGYVDRAFAVDLGYQHEIVENGRWILAVGLRIFIN